MDSLQAKWFGLYFEIEDNPKLHNSIFCFITYGTFLKKSRLDSLEPVKPLYPLEPVAK